MNISLEVSDLKKQHADYSANNPDLWPLKFAVARSNGSSLTPCNTIRNAPHKQEKSDKKVGRPKLNGKCTNDTNRRSRVRPVYFIYHYGRHFRRKVPLHIFLLQGDIMTFTAFLGVLRSLELGRHLSWPVVDIFEQINLSRHLPWFSTTGDNDKPSG